MVRKSWRRLSGLIALGLTVGVYLWAAPSVEADHVDIYHSSSGDSTCQVQVYTDDSDNWLGCNSSSANPVVVYELSADVIDTLLGKNPDDDPWTWGDDRLPGDDNQEDPKDFEGVLNEIQSRLSLVQPGRLIGSFCSYLAFDEESLDPSQGKFIIAKFRQAENDIAERFSATACNQALENKDVFLFCDQNQLFRTDQEGGRPELQDNGAYPNPDCVFLATASSSGNGVELEINPGPGPSTSTPPENSESEDSTNALVADNPEQACSGPTLRSLDWLWCGLLDSISDGIESLERSIYGHLRIDREKYQGVNCDGNNPTGPCNYRKAWSNVRNLTTLAIVGTALVMVIATALDFGWFSNYTVKKYLARLIAGTILVQLSWAVGDFIIVFGNQLGSFIGGVITAPFQGSTVGTVNAEDIGLAEVFPRVGATYAVSAGFLALGAAAWFGFIGIFPIVLTLIAGGLMILAGFMFLVFREFMIIMLLVAAPFGVALWFLPGSDKTWRLYYRTFLSLVLIYPIIVAVIAAGRSFIWVLLNSGSYGPIDSFVAFIVYVGMFAAIPLLFKRFMGSINQLTGGTNNPAKGFIDRVRNARKGYWDRGRGVRRGRQDEKDTERVARTEGKGIGSRIIGFKRSYRAGTPPMAIRRQTRQDARAVIDIEQAKKRKDLLEDNVRGIEQNQQYRFTDEGNQSLENLAGDTGQRQLRRQAALAILSKRKQNQRLRQLHTDLDPDGRRAWGAVAADGTFHKDLKDVDYGLATGNIYNPNDPMSAYNTLKGLDIPNEELTTQNKAAIIEYSQQVQSLLASHTDKGDASKVVQQFMGQVESVLGDPWSLRKVPPQSRTALEDLKNSYDQTISAKVTTKGGTIQAGQLQGMAVNSSSTIDAEIERRAAITVAATAGHESVVRDVYSSTDQNVQGSLKVIIKGGGLKGGNLERAAPQLANLSVGDKGALSKPEDFNWIRQGLDQDQLLMLSDQSVADFENYVVRQLPKARTNAQLRKRLQASVKPINEAAAAAHVAGWQQKVDAFERIEDKIGNAVGTAVDTDKDAVDTDE